MGQRSHEEQREEDRLATLVGSWAYILFFGRASGSSGVWHVDDDFGSLTPFLNFLFSAGIWNMEYGNDTNNA
jgi:hypothetical protein